MRILLAGLFLLPGATGCCITTGQCDCASECDHCTMYGVGAVSPAVHVSPVSAVESSKPMPKAGE